MPIDNEHSIVDNSTWHWFLTDAARRRRNSCNSILQQTVPSPDSFSSTYKLDHTAVPVLQIWRLMMTFFPHDRNIWLCLCRRLVLDEAHNIRNKGTAVSVACCALQGDLRWCLTGTPIVNGPVDAYALFKFLHYRCPAVLAFGSELFSVSSTSLGSSIMTVFQYHADRVQKGGNKHASAQRCCPLPCNGRCACIL